MPLVRSTIGQKLLRPVRRGVGDLVCPDYPDQSTCYDNSVCYSGTGPLLPGQTRCAGPVAGVPTTAGVSFPPSLANVPWWAWLGAGAIGFLAIKGLR